MDQSVAIQEKNEILRKYRHLIEVWTTRKTTKDQWDVRRAFRMAADAHKDMRRKSGEPFILHPIAVATIAAEEIGLGRTSIIAALLHDTVEDTDISLDDVEKMFGNKVAKIIDGLTKIDEISDNNTTAQSATLKKIILTLSDDVRVILIKLADRLHNMRTMGIMAREKQLRIASETLFIYAPLAYRLGLFSMKSELEDLSFKYSQPEAFQEISQKMDEIRQEKINYLLAFVEPVKKLLKEKNLHAELEINEKTAYSVWKKMYRTELPFEEIYNSFSINIIVNNGSLDESLQCWAVYSVVASIYKSNNKKLRDWMSTPKANGYEAIHTTVMGHEGHWVDIHIRTKRMDDIARKGYAAYLKYKGDSLETGSLDRWLKKTKELLMENDEEESISFVSDFKQELFSDEIYVFTPKGEMVTLPKGATVLDFAYAIHTDLGNQAIGANLNRRLVSIDHKLLSGDQIEIITSKVQEPTDDWYHNAVTARAKAKIKSALKNKRKRFKAKGEEKLQAIFEKLGLEYNQRNLQLLQKDCKAKGQIDFFYFLATDKIGINEVREALHMEDSSAWSRIKKFSFPFISRTGKKESVSAKNKSENLAIESDEYIDMVISKCCNPIPGDDVMALQIPGEPIQVHRIDCDEAVRLMSVYGRNIVKGRWKQPEGYTYLAGIQIKARDIVGLLNKITDLISVQYQLNMHNISMTNKEGLVNIIIKIYIDNKETLKIIIQQLNKIPGIIKADRTTRF